jgi:hypothetical protein
MRLFVSFMFRGDCSINIFDIPTDVLIRFAKYAHREFIFSGYDPGQHSARLVRPVTQDVRYAFNVHSIWTIGSGKVLGRTRCWVCLTWVLQICRFLRSMVNLHGIRWIWQTELMVGLKVLTCVRTTNMGTHFCVCHCFLACTRPPDSIRNKYTDDITYEQEHSQSQSLNTCNQLVIPSPLHLTFTLQFWAKYNIEEVILSSTLNHYVRSPPTGTIDISSSPKYIDYVRSPMSVDIHQDYFIFLGLKL